MNCVRNFIICLILVGLAFSNRSGMAAGPDSPHLEQAKLISIFPASGATNVCIDTPLHLTFSSPPVLSKTGEIRIVNDAGAVIDSIDVSSPTATKIIGGLPNFNYYPIVISGNEAIIAFKNSILAYAKSYSVKIPDGLFVDTNGNPIDLDATKNWRFSTKASAPAFAADGPRKLTVSSGGTGDFSTVQGALDFVPDDNTTPTTLFLKKGTFNEIDYVANKNNLTILGEDRKQSIIAYADNQNLNNTDRTAMPGGYRRGMFRAVNCNDLVITNLTLHNTTPHGGSQAEAIIINGGTKAHAIIAGVDMYSFQDTLQINGNAYVSDCHIEGDVDFMWGTGPVFFENCQCIALHSNAYYTQIRNTAANHGYVYDHCLFDGAPGVTGNFLSRIAPMRFPASEVVLLNCTLTKAVGDAAWRFDNFTAAAPTPDIHFWEFNCTDADGKPIDNSKRFPASKRLTKDADAATIADYSNPTWVLGNDWTPKVPANISTQPAVMQNRN
jgi:hypothetical protein